MTTPAAILDAAPWVDLVVGFATLVALFLTLGKWFVRLLAAEVRDLITEKTRPIQPGENGGESLADANRKIDALITGQDEIKASIDDVRDEARASARRANQRLDDHFNNHK